MSGRELNEKLNYLGMERAVRRLAVSDELATAEDVALMTAPEVCDLIMEYYEVVYIEPEKIGLVRSTDMTAYEKLVKRISR